MKRTLYSTCILLLLSPTLFAGLKVARNVSYGPHERNIMDIYWDSSFKNAPIVFTIHGGGFKVGSKAYCNADMQQLFLEKGCVVVSPNYRLLKKGTPVTIADCEIDCAMAVAHMQAHAEKYGADPKRIVATGGSAGGYLSARIAYRKQWSWPRDAAHKPDKLNIIGWYGDSPGLPPHVIKSVKKGDPPGFMIYAEREHPATPARSGHAMQAAMKAKGVWNQLVYVEKGRHVSGRHVLIHSRKRDKKVHAAFEQFLDMVCYGKGSPAGGSVITVVKKD